MSHKKEKMPRPRDAAKNTAFSVFGERAHPLAKGRPFRLSLDPNSLDCLPVGGDKRLYGRVLFLYTFDDNKEEKLTVSCRTRTWVKIRSDKDAGHYLEGGCLDDMPSSPKARRRRAKERSGRAQ